MRLPKKPIIIALIIVVSFSIYAMILYSIPITTSNRDHEVANVVVFSKGKDTSLITSLEMDAEAIHLTIITRNQLVCKLNYMDDRFI